MVLVKQITLGVRGVMRHVARFLDRMTGGRLNPNMVTIIGLLAHVPIAWLIATHHPVWAGVLLLIFGLFDTLDGELARLQGKSSRSGMFLDSVCDRIKEILIYVGLIAAVANWPGSCGIVVDACMYSVNLYFIFLMLALGGSLLTSYINAWGEAVLHGSKVKKEALNNTFRGGAASFEIRMFLLVIMLLFGWQMYIIPLIAVLAWYTAFSRMNRVLGALSDVQD